MYDTDRDVSNLYRSCSWLWCMCLDPKYTVTESFVQTTEYGLCGSRMNSMAMENINDVRRKQCCCWVLWSCCPCTPCCDDVASIIIYGKDDSTDGNEWELVRVHNSMRVFNMLTTKISETHKEWRLKARNMARKANQIKNEMN